MIRIEMNSMVRKPMVSETSAITPGASSFFIVSRDPCMGDRRGIWEVSVTPSRAQSSGVRPPNSFSTIQALIFCTPWLTPMANTRNGVRMFIGSRL
jgi:hypothetical protein